MYRMPMLTSVIHGLDLEAEDGERVARERDDGEGREGRDDSR